VLALFLLGTMRNGMGLANVAGPTQTIVLGALLIIGVLRPILFRGVARGYRFAFSRHAVASN
jgi:rhamnose transport system permease protein